MALPLPLRGAGRAAIAAGLVLLSAPALDAASAGTAHASPGSHSATTTDRAEGAAGWLARQLKNGRFIDSPFGPDYGLTADTVLALDASGVAQGDARTATSYLASHVGDYAGAGTERYAGSLAKLGLVAIAQRSNARDFGGTDLVAELGKLECGPQRPACASDAGRFEDQSAYGDFSNVITQSLAVLALTRAKGVDPSDDAVGYLADARCPDGGFPTYFDTDTCRSAPDATGFAVQALVAAHDQRAERGVRWLRANQADDGSFASDDADKDKAPVANANSTGLAAQGLVAGDQPAAARRARAFLVSLELGCFAKHDDRGAVVFAKSDVRKYRRAHKLEPNVTRATAQAVPALAGQSLATASRAGAGSEAPHLRCTTATPTPSPSPSPTKSSTPQPTSTATAAPTPRTSSGSGASRSHARSSTATEGSGRTAPNSGAASLAATGGHAPELLLTGSGLILAGALLLLAARRRGRHQ